MIEATEKDNRERYVDWLSQKVSPAQLSELYMSYEVIDEFCIKTKVLKQSLLKTTDIDIIKMAQKLLSKINYSAISIKEKSVKFVLLCDIILHT